MELLKSIFDYKCQYTANVIVDQAIFEELKN